jgi:diguanylate cyclase (GGDEF)-like protein
MAAHLKQQSGQTAGNSGKQSGNTEDLKLCLLERLQTTLDIRTQLSLILATTSNALHLDGARFEHEILDINETGGRKALHSCGYRLITPTENLGELIFMRNEKFSDTEMQLIESLLTTIMPPLRNALRFRLAMDTALHDPLTGARNERNLNQVLPREIGLARRHNRQLSGILVDIDHLASLNETLGKLTGDRVLRQLVDNIRMLCRNTDLVFRLGSDELLVLLHDTEERCANRIAARIHKASQDLPMSIDGQSLSAPVHVATVRVTGTDSARSFINRGYRLLQKCRQTDS